MQKSMKFISFDALKRRGSSAVTVVKLMMAYNDLSLANQALTAWEKDLSKHNESRHVGARMYFVRTQLAHLYEGFKIIETVRSDSALMTLVRQCDQQTQQSFHNLEPFLIGGSKRQELQQLMGQVRHNLTFHYDESGKLIEKAIADKAGRAEVRTSSITRGSSAPLWHFQVADDVVDSIVVRQIWRIPQDADVRAETDNVAARVHQIFLWFMDFSGEFIWRYCQS